MTYPCEALSSKHGSLAGQNKDICVCNTFFNQFFAFATLTTGMQDYNYLHTNSFELTLELGCDKFPADKRLKTFWDDNKPALIAFMEMVGNHRNPGPKKTYVGLMEQYCFCR